MKSPIKKSKPRSIVRLFEEDVVNCSCDKKIDSKIKMVSYLAGPTQIKNFDSIESE